MEINAIQHGTVTLVRISGTVDALTSGEVTRFFDELIAENYTLIAIDMSDLDYMSSAGLRVLLLALKQVRPLEGDLRLASPQDAVLRVLRMAGLTSIIEVYNTVEEALQSFA
jgi:anti-anti-sigma factor